MLRLRLCEQHEQLTPASVAVVTAWLRIRAALDSFAKRVGPPKFGGLPLSSQSCMGPDSHAAALLARPTLQPPVKLARASQDVQQSAALRFLTGMAIRASVVRQPDRRATLFDPFFRIDCRSLPSELQKSHPGAGFLPNRCHRLSGCLTGHRFIQPRPASSRYAHSFVHAQRTCHSLASFAPSTAACYPPRKPQMQSRCRASEPEPHLHRPVQLATSEYGLRVHCGENQIGGIVQRRQGTSASF